MTKISVLVAFLNLVTKVQNSHSCSFALNSTGKPNCGLAGHPDTKYWCYNCYDGSGYYNDN